MSFVSALLAASSEHAHGGPPPKLPELLQLSNAELAARIRDGDEAAFDTLYRTFYPRLVALARGYVPVETAEELVQDVFMHTWERRTDWSPTDDIGIYLYASVRNRAISVLRHDRVVGRAEEMALETGVALAMGNPDVGADVQLERTDLQLAVAGVLAGLPEGMRTAFTLRWIHELSYAEVARIMGISEPAARKQVSRARDAVIPVLRRFMTD